MGRVGGQVHRESRRAGAGQGNDPGALEGTDSIWRVVEGTSAEAAARAGRGGDHRSVRTGKKLIPRASDGRRCRVEPSVHGRVSGAGGDLAEQPAAVATWAQTRRPAPDSETHRGRRAEVDLGRGARSA